MSPSLSNDAAIEQSTVPVRRLSLRFSPEAIPHDWYAEDEHLSLLWSALSTLFPEGEQFFVDSVRHYKDHIDDPVLAADVTGFIGQEAMHSKEHAAFNAMLEAQGLDVAGDVHRELGRGLAFVRKLLGPEEQLAVTCALEHYTAILAEQLLEDPRHRANIHPDMLGLWVWHALEESEHKHVAFDVYQKVDGSYARRVALMLLTTAVFVPVVAVVHARMLRERRLLLDLRGTARTLRFFWLEPGLFRGLIPAYLDYFRPGFHPADRDTRALLAEWNARLFGEGGLLEKQLAQVRLPRVQRSALA